MTATATASSIRGYLRNLVAQDADGPKGKPRGVLYGVSADLVCESLAIVGTPEDGTHALADVLTGRIPATRGTLSIEGKDPFRTPSLRARIASAGREPGLPDAGNVGRTVALALSAWGSPKSVDEVLSRFSLSGLAGRSVGSLSDGDTFSVELALALSMPAPALLVLFEPFARPSAIDRARIEGELSERAAQCPVIVVTSSPRDAKACARGIVLHRGAFVRQTQAPHDELGPRVGLESVTIWVAAGARSLVRELAAVESLSSVAFDAAPSDAAEGAGVVRIAGSSGEEIGLAVADAVQRAGASLKVTAMAEGTPGLAEVRAATDFDLRGRHLAAMQAQAADAKLQAEARNRGMFGAPVAATPAPPAVTAPAAPAPPAPAPPEPKKDGDPS